MSASQREAAELGARAGRKHVNPAQDNIIAQRKSVQHTFGTVARALATGDQDDKRLAVEVVQFVKETLIKSELPRGTGMCRHNQ